MKSDLMKGTSREAVKAILEVLERDVSAHLPQRRGSCVNTGRRIVVDPRHQRRNGGDLC